MSKKQYKVLKPIGYSGDRFESGAIVEMPEADAINIGLEYVTPVEIETVESVEEVNEVIAEMKNVEAEANETEPTEDVESEEVDEEETDTEEETVETVEEEVKVSSKSKRGKK